MTYKDVIDYVNTNKPDMKDFWEQVRAIRYVDELLKSILTETVSELQLFKLELLFIYMTTHTREYLRENTINSYKAYLEKLQIAEAPRLFKGHVHSYNKTTYNSLYNFDIQDVNQSTILYQVVDSKQYLNNYLKGKLRTSAGVSTAYGKKIKDDQMSLAVFTQWLSTVKSLNSVQAMEFLEQCMYFNLAKDYLDLIISNCPKPSIQMQKFISGAFRGNPKYTSLNRYTIRNYSANIISFSEVFNDRDSDYRPFITNIPRKAPDTESEFENSLGAALTLLQYGNLYEFLYTELISHLKQGSTELQVLYLDKLKSASIAIDKLIKDMS